VSFVKIGAVSVMLAKLNIYFIFCIFWPFLIKFGIVDLHISSSISCEFRKNWYRKGRTLLQGVNEIVSVV
jgi:hypothetical protein